MTDSRSSILARIRAANGATTNLADAEAEWHGLKREYARVGSRSRIETIQLLVERLRHYDAEVHICDHSHLTSVLTEVLQRLRAFRVAVPSLNLLCDLPHDFQFLSDSEISITELDGVDAVLTSCTCAIAETGTLVLQSSAEEGRRASSLVPDVHICLLPTSLIVETVPEAFARLRPTANLPTTFVSGPSATADIEMTRVKGVHGPRFLHVLLVSEESEIAALQ